MPDVNDLPIFRAQLPTLPNGQPDWRYVPGSSPDFQPTPSGWVYTGTKPWETGGFDLANWVKQNSTSILIGAVMIFALSLMRGKR